MFYLQIYVKMIAIWNYFYKKDLPQLEACLFKTRQS